VIALPDGPLHEELEDRGWKPGQAASSGDASVIALLDGSLREELEEAVPAPGTPPEAAFVITTRQAALEVPGTCPRTCDSENKGGGASVGSVQAERMCKLSSKKGL